MSPAENVAVEHSDVTAPSAHGEQGVDGADDSGFTAAAVGEDVDSAIRESAPRIALPAGWTRKRLNPPVG